MLWERKKTLTRETLKTREVQFGKLHLIRSSGMAGVAYTVEVVFVSGRGETIVTTADRYEAEAYIGGAYVLAGAWARESERISRLALPQERTLATYSAAGDTFTLVERTRNGDMRIDVKSRSGNDYTITRDADGIIVCNCKGFVFGHYCRHSAQAAALIRPGKPFAAMGKH